MADVFLSYASQDREFVEAVRDGLEHHGISTWMDHHHIQGGDTWEFELESNIRNSKVFVVTVTEASNNSEWVRRECILAEQLGMVRIPLLLTGKLPFRLLHLHYVDFSEESIDQGSKLLLGILEKHLQHADGNATTKQVVGAEPQEQSPEADASFTQAKDVERPLTISRRRRRILLAAGGVFLVVLAATLAAVSVPARETKEKNPPTLDPAHVQSSGPSDSSTVPVSQSQAPSGEPSDRPTAYPSNKPSQQPSFNPTSAPAQQPTSRATPHPTTATPTKGPTPFPSPAPTPQPTTKSPTPLRQGTETVQATYTSEDSYMCGINVCKNEGWGPPFVAEQNPGYWFMPGTASFACSQYSGSLNQLEAHWTDCVACYYDVVGLSSQVVQTYPRRVELRAHARSRGCYGCSGTTTGTMTVTWEEIPAGIHCEAAACETSDRQTHNCV